MLHLFSTGIFSRMIMNSLCALTKSFFTVELLSYELHLWKNGQTFLLTLISVSCHIFFLFLDDSINQKSISVGHYNLILLYDQLVIFWLNLYPCSPSSQSKIHIITTPFITRSIFLSRISALVNISFNLHLCYVFLLSLIFFSIICNEIETPLNGW